MRMSLEVQAVRSIGQCAVSLESAAERCINVLLELIRNKVNYVVQESIIVIKDIFRRYPNRQVYKMLFPLCFPSLVRFLNSKILRMDSKKVSGKLQPLNNKRSWRTSPAVNYYGQLQASRQLSTVDVVAVNHF